MPAKKKTATAKATPAAPKAVSKAPAKKAPAKKAEPVKAPAAAAPAKKAAAPKATPAKKTPAKKTAAKAKVVLSPEERYQKVQTEAYYIAEKHGFSGDDLIYWLEAEKKVAAELA